MILYSLGVSLGGSLSAHAGQLATVRFLLRSSLGSLFELLAGCSRRGGGLSSGLLVGRHSERFPLSRNGEGRPLSCHDLSASLQRSGLF